MDINYICERTVYLDLFNDDHKSNFNDFSNYISAISLLIIYIATNSNKVIAFAFCLFYLVTLNNLMFDVCEKMTDDKNVCISSSKENLWNWITSMFFFTDHLKEEIAKCNAQTGFKFNVIEITVKAFIRSLHLFFTFTVSCLMNFLFVIRRYRV